MFAFVNQLFKLIVETQPKAFGRRVCVYARVCTCVYLSVERTCEHALMKQGVKSQKCLSVSALCQVLYLIYSS